MTTEAGQPAEVRHSVEDAFTRMLGRTPSDHERQRLYRVRDALGLGNNDALWLVLLALDHYDTLYGQIPARIAAKAKEVLEREQGAIEAVIRAKTAEVQASLAKAVEATVDRVATHKATTARIEAWAWAFVGVFAFGAFCTMIGWFMGGGKLHYWHDSSSVVMQILSMVYSIQAGYLITPAFMVAIGVPLYRAVQLLQAEPDFSESWPVYAAAIGLGLVEILSLVAAFVLLNPSS